MLKDKNLLKAVQIAEEEGVDVKMPIEKLAELQIELEIAERAYDEQAAVVKKHNNEVYAPMCAIKTDLEIRMQVLRIKFAKVTAANPTFAALVKMARKAAKAKK